MKFKVNDGTQLRTIIGAIQILSDEAELKLNGDGVRIRQMDPSRVAMVDLFWPKTAFEEYTAPKEKEKVRLNLAELMKLLKRAGKDEPIELELDSKTGRVQVRITGKYARHFTLPSLEADQEDLPMPKVTFNVKAKLTTDGIKQAIEDAQLVSDHVKMQAEKESLKLLASGDLMSADIVLKKGSDVVLDIAVKEEGKATYSLSYLKDMITFASAFSSVASLEFSSDMPAKIDCENQGITLMYFMAPRIETE